MLTLMRLLVSVGVAAALPVLAADGVSAPPALSPRLERSAELIGSYYGDQQLLRDAAALVAEELRESPRSAAAWSQAAQITIKGGHVVGPKFKPGTKQLYRALIDRALDMDPRYAPALSLRAESQFLEGDVDGGCDSARIGLAIDPHFPWLHLAMARCHDLQNRVQQAIIEIQIVVQAGVGTTRDQRRAYPQAMIACARHFLVPENLDMIQDMARRTTAVLDPRDAWTLGSCAGMFNQLGDYDDGIAYARKALAVMDYGVGRSILAEALEGKAAQLKAAGVDDRAIIEQLRGEPVPTR